MSRRVWVGFAVWIILLGIGVLHAQVVKKNLPLLQDMQVPLEVRCELAKDVGVPGNLYQDDLYALAHVSRGRRPISDAKVLVSRVLLDYSEYFQRYQGRIWAAPVPQSVELAIKTGEGHIIRGMVTRDYETKILAPTDQSHQPPSSALKVSWQFSGNGAPAELNVFEQGTLKHIFQLKNIFKNGAVVPADILKPGQSYLVQVRGKAAIGKFSKSDILLDRDSQIRYSASHAVTVHIDQ